MTISLHACPRCNGAVMEDRDMYGVFRSCLNCSFHPTLETTAAPKGNHLWERRTLRRDDLNRNVAIINSLEDPSTISGIHSSTGISDDIIRSNLGRLSKMGYVEKRGNKYISTQRGRGSAALYDRLPEDARNSSVVLVMYEYLSREIGGGYTFLIAATTRRKTNADIRRRGYIEDGKLTASGRYIGEISMELAEIA